VDLDIELDDQVEDEPDTGREGMPSQEVCAPGFVTIIYPKAQFLERFIVKGKRRCWHEVRGECNAETTSATCEETHLHVSTVCSRASASCEVGRLLDDDVIV
jgi:hypothetical protein